MGWLLIRHISGIAFRWLSPHIVKGRLCSGRRSVPICRWKSVTSRTLYAKALRAKSSASDSSASGREIK